MTKENFLDSGTNVRMPMKEVERAQFFKLKDKHKID